MNIKKVKLEFFYFRRAFHTGENGFSYLYNKYIVAPKILKSKKVFEKPINNDNLSIHVLTCHKDFIMTIWSLKSFYNVSTIFGQLFIHDDGSLTDDDVSIINKFFPSSIIINSTNFITDYGYKLDNYATLKEFRLKYDNFSFKKIIDPYFVSDKKMRLIIDSDVYWFKTPFQIEEQIKNNGHKSFMQDNVISIGVTFKDGTEIEDKLTRFNAGIIFYSVENFNIDKFNTFLNKLDVKKLKNLHFVDQLGHAYCLDNLEPLPAASYIIKGNVNKDIILKHYTSPRRHQFFLESLGFDQKIDKNIVDPNKYDSETYLNKDRWVSYFWQTYLVRENIKTGNILEIGIGNGMVKDFLSKKYQVLTADINNRLNPDFICSVDNLNKINNDQFDLVLCAEVLEHLPFDKFNQSIKELKRVSRKKIIISLPFWGYTFGCKIKLPVFGTKTIKFKISGIKKHKFNGEHYWEIGKHKYPLKRIKKIIANNNLKIIKSFWDIDDPYHYYFIIEK